MKNLSFLSYDPDEVRMCKTLSGFKKEQASGPVLMSMNHGSVDAKLMNERPWD